MNRDVWKEVEKENFAVKFIPHEKIKDYIACYRVIYNGREIYPPAALHLGIPRGEIWLSDAFKEYASYILFHEIQEIKHRAEGYGVDEAHHLALKDEERKFQDDEKWKKMKREINICTYETLLSTPGIGKVLAEKIMENRPYDSMEDLKKVEGIGKKRYAELRRNFWCILEKR